MSTDTLKDAVRNFEQSEKLVASANSRLEKDKRALAKAVVDVLRNSNPNITADKKKKPTRFENHKKYVSEFKTLEDLNKFHLGGTRRKLIKLLRTDNKDTFTVKQLNNRLKTVYGKSISVSTVRSTLHILRNLDICRYDLSKKVWVKNMPAVEKLVFPISVKGEKKQD
jgi:hypothetical protein